MFDELFNGLILAIKADPDNLKNVGKTLYVLRHALNELTDIIIKASLEHAGEKAIMAGMKTLADKPDASPTEVQQVIMDIFVAHLVYCCLPSFAEKVAEVEAKAEAQEWPDVIGEEEHAGH